MGIARPGRHNLANRNMSSNSLARYVLESGNPIELHMHGRNMKGRHVPDSIRVSCF